MNDESSQDQEQPFEKPQMQYNEADAEVDKMIQSMREMGADIRHQLAYIYDLGKKNNIDVDKYLSYIRKWSPQELEKLNQEKLEMLNRIKKIIPGTKGAAIASKSEQQLTQERKGKMRGMRKKWIPM